MYSHWVVTVTGTKQCALVTDASHYRPFSCNASANSNQQWTLSKEKVSSQSWVLVSNFIQHRNHILQQDKVAIFALFSHLQHITPPRWVRVDVSYEVVSLIFFLFRFELGWVQKGFNSNEEYLTENSILQSSQNHYSYCREDVQQHIGASDHSYH